MNLYVNSEKKVPQMLNCMFFNVTIKNDVNLKNTNFDRYINYMSCNIANNTSYESLSAVLYKYGIIYANYAIFIS